MPLFDSRYPVFQAPIGSIATAELISAVAAAGGVGALAITWDSAAAAIAKIKQLRAEEADAFFINYVLGWEPRTLDQVLAEAVPAISFSWGQPGALIPRVQRSGALAGVQVGTVDGARRALDDGADFIICQGREAGGHVQSSTPLEQLLDAVIETAEAVPVVAAGGLADGGDLHWALARGASAVMMGTRFIATRESNAHPLYKQALVEAASSDSVYTLCFDGDWPYAAHRVLRNSTLNGWENAGCPPTGKRPGEDEIIARDEAGNQLKRYSDEPPLMDMQGQVLDTCLYAGTGCGQIRDVPPVKDLLDKIGSECKAISG